MYKNNLGMGGGGPIFAQKNETNEKIE